MAGIANTNSYDTHVGDGVTTVFPFTFFAYTASQVKVYTIDADGLIDDVTLDVVIAVNSSFIGGSVTFSPAPGVLDILIQRTVAYKQETEFADLARYKETAIEQALNNLEMQIQQVNDRANLSLAYLPTAGATNATILSYIDGNFLLFNADGSISPGGDAADIAAAGPAAAVAVDAAADAEAARDAVLAISGNLVTAAAVFTDNCLVQSNGTARTVDANATGNRVLKGWFTDIESTNAPTVNGTGTLINSEPAGVTGADKVSNILSLTTAEYGAIGAPNASTIYIITDA